ncbi:MAG: phosphoglycerate dehydrogenase [Anaerolineae bacterium]|nr:phosphoglycerate dehydrogenase [Chloroflexota bacterium]
MAFRVGMGIRWPEYYGYMREAGFDIVEVPFARNTEDLVIENYAGVNAVVAMGEPFTPRVLEALKDNLRFIIRHGVGYDKIDVPYATRLGICVCNTPGAMSTGVGETTIALMLEISRGFFRSDREIKGGGYSRGPVTRGLEGATVGLIGFGNIGQKVARLLQGFNCRILAYDVRYNEARVQELGVEKASLEQIARESDFVSVHVPLMPATAKMVDAAFMARMKPSAYLINTSRGGTVDEEALIQALKQGTIAGAGLDVFAIEPLPPESELRQLDNVFLTGHLATQTTVCIQAGFDSIIRSLREFQAGEIPFGCLNPDYVHNRPA